MTPEKEYKLKILEYKSMAREMKKAERLLNFDEVAILDRERDQIHRDLKALADVLGKSHQDVDIDLLAEANDLREHDLPEFRLVRTAEALELPYIYKIEGENVIDPDQNASVLVKTEDELKDLELFIPFGEDVYWHLFDEQMFRSVPLTGPERRRRALNAIDNIPAGLHFVEIHSQETFHNAIALFGIAFKKSDLDTVLNFMRINQELVTIDETKMDREQILKDYEAVIKKEIREIRNYFDELTGRFGIDFTRETELDLLSKLKNEKSHEFNTDEKFKEIADRLFKEALKEAELRDMRREVQLDDLTEETNPFSDEFQRFPKFESFGKRLR